MGKYHLQMNNVPSSSFKLPTLGLSKGGFELPKLRNIPSSSSDSAGSSSLADFAKSQLENCVQSDQTKSHFTIPKLFPARNDLVPIDGMRNLEIEPQKILIDLKSALVTETEMNKASLATNKKVKQEVENFIPQFVDCDNAMNISSKDLTLDDRCERVTLRELSSRYKNCSLRRFSMMGKIIGRKFMKKIPRIDHGYEQKHFIEPFKFDTPSPDDKILAHLNKKKI